MTTIITSPNYTYNFFWDHNDPAHPFEAAVICNKLSIIPEYATRFKPQDTKDGTTPCWDGEIWVTKMDWRQIKLWDKVTGKLVKYPTVDFDPKDTGKYTQIPPTGEFVKWEDKQWVYDEDKEVEYNCKLLEKKRTQLLYLCAEQIDMLSDIILYGEENGTAEKYKAPLVAWRKYRGALAVMKITTGKEVFPTQPPKWDEI